MSRHQIKERRYTGQRDSSNRKKSGGRGHQAFEGECWQLLMSAVVTWRQSQSWFRRKAANRRRRCSILRRRPRFSRARVSTFGSTTPWVDIAEDDGHPCLRSRRRLLPVRRPWPRIHRRHLRTVGRQCRPWPQRDRRGHGRAGRPPRVCLRRLVHDRARGQTRRDARGIDARRSQPRLLLLRRIGSGRNGDEDRQAGPIDARFPSPLQDDRPARLLPRHDARRDEPDALQERSAFRPVHVWRLACLASESLPVGLRAFKAKPPTSPPPKRSSTRSSRRTRKRSPR